LFFYFRFTSIVPFTRLIRESAKKLEKEKNI